MSVASPKHTHTINKHASSTETSRKKEGSKRRSRNRRDKPHASRVRVSRVLFWDGGFRGLSRSWASGRQVVRCGVTASIARFQASWVNPSRSGFDSPQRNVFFFFFQLYWFDMAGQVDTDNSSLRSLNYHSQINMAYTTNTTRATTTTRNPKSAPTACQNAPTPRREGLASL